ncbi:hypothetical protein [Pseudoprimorskyibacter insulae]|uniref:Uncharacterized protein n=1 Tax=Pseudoprimorskyibacter insulae TaxID=1695997 RepID=A0A2R8APS4_9RHOB|nr:hypothetical protein [Pseudoprimorskyibacter insulae]SPF77897.1 hypothetical protein PRI8871_00484 [Pseudoprimorskyibacter insulae]
MTALQEYIRLEAAGLWRASPEDQRRDVIVSIGDASLTISDTRDQALAHWSLAAIARANKGNSPAIYYPDGSPGETLELGEDELEMIAAIDKVRRVVESRRPKPGRLRLYVFGGVSSVLLSLGVFWLPGALMRHTVKVVPPAKRAEIGDALLGRIIRVSGQPCNDSAARVGLQHLSERLLGDANLLVVLPGGVVDTAHLPGGKILLNRALVEDPEDPDVTAGYILAETVRQKRSDPLDDLLQHSGLVASLRLLTSGSMPEKSLQSFAEWMLTQPPIPVDETALIDAFQKAGVRSRPYAYAVDVTGEQTLGLIEADPLASSDSGPVLSDGDWVRLQGICGA